MVMCNEYIEACEKRRKSVEKALAIVMTATNGPDEAFMDVLDAYIFGKISLEVILTAHKENRIELFFIVNDTGIGIDKADKDKLFKSFSQVDASISRRYGGTGLGLNICKQLVELLDGNIHVESEEGKGSMFSFHIWVEIPQDEIQDAALQALVGKTIKPLHLANMEENQNLWVYGTDENLDEIKRKMSKLILSVEMDNWEKAEQFMDALRKLTENAPQEIKSAVLRLKMAVQKEDYDKTTVSFEKLQLLL